MTAPTQPKSPSSISRKSLLTGMAAAAVIGVSFQAAFTSDARAEKAVSLDGNPITKLIPATLENAAGKTVSREQLAGKYVGVYFSAHWCPPCQVFTPKLAKFYNRNREDLEIVFVSADLSAAEKAEYIKEVGMKWLTVPGQSNAQTEKMGGMLGVQGIPTLAIFDPSGQLLTTDGRAFVENSPFSAMKTWKKASEDSRK